MGSSLGLTTEHIVLRYKSAFEHRLLAGELKYRAALGIA